MNKFDDSLMMQLNWKGTIPTDLDTNTADIYLFFYIVLIFKQKSAI